MSCTEGPGHGTPETKRVGRGRAASQAPANVSWHGGLDREMWLPSQDPGWGRMLHKFLADPME